jgi:para-nitrobenzyl esterase
MFKLVFAIVLASLSAHAIDINTRSGVVTGFPSGTAFVFKGIPYAAPPVGDLRWAAPQDPVPWKSNRLAYSYSSKCPQASLANKSIRFGDEDCLYLNVFRPQNITKPLPVMVFIHGGGNTV